jgi:NAD(P)-dependent dehydrogenase (short-subunit alcohol dehydrogenase family)
LNASSNGATNGTPGGSLSGSIVLVTGASRGIGAATAQHFARLGAQVVINYNTDQAGAESVAQTIADAGGKARIMQANVGSEADVRRLASQIESDLGPLRVVVHNASAIDRTYFLDVTLDQFDEMFHVNVRGPFLLSQIAARQMIAAGKGGSIVHVSTILAQLAIENRTLYIATKGALEALTRAMALDLIQHNIRVNAVAPGLIDTQALKDSTARIGPEKFLTHLPGHRFGRAEEVAAAIAFLASDASSYITGALLPVDHGLGIREAGPK